MGSACCSSGTPLVIEGAVVRKYEPHFPDHYDLVVEVPKAFSEADKDGSGELVSCHRMSRVMSSIWLQDYREFVQGFQLEPTLLTKRLFEVFDADQGYGLSW